MHGINHSASINIYLTSKFLFLPNKEYLNMKILRINKLQFLTININLTTCLNLLSHTKNKQHNFIRIKN